MPEIDINQETFEKWKALTGKSEGYVAIVDGDLVEYGHNFPYIAVNASELRSQRGDEAVLSIFDASTGTSTPPTESDEAI
jgi:hypothetical protein